MPTGESVDLSGRVFGSLTVLHRIGTRTYSYRYGKITKPLWLCRCNGKGRKCRRELPIESGPLLQGRVHSCGCLKTYKFSSPQTYLFGRYRHQARKLGREFSLSKKEFISLIESKCHYCGHPPAQKLVNVLPAHPDFTYNGIDREDNELGYTKTNVISCCGVCNRMKSSKSSEDFLRQVEAIHIWQQGRNPSAVA